MKKRVKSSKSGKVKRRVKVKRQAVALELLRQEDRLWHYTTWPGLVGILGNQVIVPNFMLHDRIEQPIYVEPLSGIWCSYAQGIERALPGMLIKRLLPKEKDAQRFYASKFGLARIRVNPASAPFTVGDADGLEPDELLVDDVRRIGSRMENWRIGHGGIPSTDWLAVEFWDFRDGWTSVEDARQPQVISLWPLLPVWMRKGCLCDTGDPDRILKRQASLATAIDENVDRLEAARSSFWLLMRDGAMNGAFTLAYQHAGFSEFASRLSPLDKAACQADLAMWYRFRGQDDQADALTVKASAILYNMYNRVWRPPELEGAKFRQHIEKLVRTSSTAWGIRCAEISVPVALRLMLSRRGSKFTAEVDEMCEAIGGLCRSNPAAYLMAVALSRWLGSGFIQLPIGEDERMTLRQVLPPLATYGL